MTKETKSELRERIEELEWEHRVLAKQGVADAAAIAKRDGEIEQLHGQARLVAMQHAEECEQLAVAARRSQAAYESTQSERQPAKLGTALDDAAMTSVRIKLEALDALAVMIETHFDANYMGGQNTYTLQEQLHSIIESDKMRASIQQRLNALTSTHTKLTATVQAAYGFVRNDGPLDIPVNDMADIVCEYVEERSGEHIVGTLSEIISIVAAVHDRVVGADRSKLTPQEQLVEIGDSAANTKRNRDDLRHTLTRVREAVKRVGE